MKPYSEKFKKQRKFLTVLPLLILPFVTMVFWALGGGQGAKLTPENNQQKGFNTELPTVKLPTGSLDKMSLYAQAEQDSQTLREARAQDPYAEYSDTETYSQASDISALGYGPSNYTDTYDSRTGWYSNPDPNEVRVQRKLAQLENALNTPAPDTDLFSTKGLPEPAEMEGTDSMEARLEQMMSGTQQQGSSDPELKQLNGMLEKILDIQHPERVSEQLKVQSEKERGQVFPVTTTTGTETASLLERPFIPPLPDSSPLLYLNDLGQNAFYDLSDMVAQHNLPGQAIHAVIHKTQTLVSGATVKLRLLQDVYINGMLIPKDNFVFGVCSLEGDRLKIQVKSIHYKDYILPVSLTVFDMDGIEGIRVPGTITRDAAKEGAGQAIQSLQFMGLNPSLASQAAGAGIETIKGLLGKKAKWVRVTVKAGYPVLLVDQKALQ